MLHFIWWLHIHLQNSVPFLRVSWHLHHLHFPPLSFSLLARISFPSELPCHYMYMSFQVSIYSSPHTHTHTHTHTHIYICLYCDIIYLPENSPILFICLFFFFFYGHTCSTWKFPGQGLNLSHSCNLHCSCGNTASFNTLHRVGELIYVSAATWAAEVGFLTYFIAAGTPKFIHLKQATQWNFVNIQSFATISTLLTVLFFNLISTV